MVAGYTTDKKSGRRIIARMPECQENVDKECALQCDDAGRHESNES